MLPFAELDFHRPAGAVDRSELTQVRLILAQIGWHEVRPVSEETFRAGIFAALPGFLATFGPPGDGDFRGRADRNETTLPVLFSADGIEVDEVSPEAFEAYLHPVGLSMLVVVCGEGGRVGFWHDLAGSVFNGDALDSLRFHVEIHLALRGRKSSFEPESTKGKISLATRAGRP